MYIQGDLQAIFDALYTVGAIDPVLKQDWESLVREMSQKKDLVDMAFSTINACRGNRQQLIHQFGKMDQKTLYYIAMEVAREFSEFYERQTLH
jgi:uncharacterized protein YutE (UPF0331/DUF86 family)